MGPERDGGKEWAKAALCLQVIFHRKQDAAVTSRLRVSAEEFNCCKTCECWSTGQKWVEVNRNRLKYAAVITSVISLAWRDCWRGYDENREGTSRDGTSGENLTLEQSWNLFPRRFLSQAGTAGAGDTSFSRCSLSKAPSDRLKRLNDGLHDWLLPCFFVANDNKREVSRGDKDKPTVSKLFQRWKFLGDYIFGGSLFFIATKDWKLIFIPLDDSALEIFVPRGIKYTIII